MNKLVVNTLCLIMLLSLFYCEMIDDKNTILNPDKTDHNDLRVLLESSMEHLLVNSVTGECKEFKISQSEAIEFAEKYWEGFDIEENEYLVEIGYNQQAPLYVHVVIIQGYVIDHYSTFDEIWIDKNTGEAIAPHWSDDGKG